MKEEIKELPAHAVLGASSSKRWFSCPGSIKLIESYPHKEDKTNAYAELGTAAHELGEKCLLAKRGKKTKPESYLGQTINGFVVDQEMIDAVKVYVDFIRKDTKGLKMQIEEKFNLSWLHPEMFGSSDCTARDHFNVLKVYDYKNGVNPVEVENNTQLLFYALGAAYDKERDSLFDFETVEMSIIQPRAFHVDGPIRTWKIPFSQLEDFAKTLKAAALETEKENATLKSGSHCHYCPALGVCPEMRKTTMEIAKTDFAQVVDTATLTTEQIGKIVNSKKMISNFLNEVEAIAFEKLNQGVEIPGVKLVQKRKLRKWANPLEVEEFLFDDLQRIGEENVFEKKLISPAKLEKLIGKKDFSDFVEFLDETNPGLTVANESDKRKEIKVNYKDDFTPVEKSK